MGLAAIPTGSSNCPLPVPLVPNFACVFAFFVELLDTAIAAVCDIEMSPPEHGDIQQGLRTAHYRIRRCRLRQLLVQISNLISPLLTP